VDLFGPEPATPSVTVPTWYDFTSQSPLWADTTPSPAQASVPIWAETGGRDSATTDAARSSWSLFGSPPEEAPVAPSMEDEIVVPEAVLSDVVEDIEDVVPEPAGDVVPEPVEAELPEPAVEPAADETTASDNDASESAAEDAPVEDVDATPDVEQPVLELGTLLARTASDPAPVSLDATTVMPPLSLLPPLPGSRGRGRPPVPPSRLPRARPSVPSTAASAFLPAATPPADEPRTPVAPALSVSPLATVTRLPVQPSESADRTDATETIAAFSAESLVDSPAAAPVDEPAEPSIEAPVEPAEATVEPVGPTGEAPAGPGDVVARLEALGLPVALLWESFAEQVAVQGTYAALTRALGLRLPPAPEVPTGAGEVLFVVGPGIETLRAARSLAVTLRLDPEKVQWATRGDLVGLAPEASRVATTDAAIDRRQAAASAGTVTIVAVDAPLRADAYWMTQMLTIWSPIAVWAVVEATRKPEDVEPWLAGLSRVDALIVQDTDLSADPAAVLRRVAAPVALLDGVRATPHRWASLLCERLEGTRS
jgi:hypothetical protein